MGWRSIIHIRKPSLVFISQGLQQVHHRKRRTGVFESRYAFGQRLAHRELHLLLRFRLGLSSRTMRSIRIQRPLHQRLRMLVHQSDRIALLILKDLTAWRIRCVPIDARQTHSLGIGKARMSAGVFQPDRIMRRNLAQLIVDRETLHVGRWWRIPLGLMPAPPQDPGSGLGFARRRGNHGDNLVPVLGIPQIQNHFGRAEAHEMPVAFDESRNGETPAQVDHFGGPSNVRLHLLIRADGHDLAAPRRQRLRLGTVRFHGDKFGVAQHQVSRLSA